MKKKIYGLVLGVSMAVNVFMLSSGTAVATQTPDNIWKSGKVEVVYSKTKDDTKKLNNMISHRKGKILINVVKGIVLDNKGNGKDTAGYYIGYNPKKYKKGDTVQSVFVFNPANNYEDDVLYRVDTKLK